MLEKPKVSDIIHQSSGGVREHFCKGKIKTRLNISGVSVQNLYLTLCLALGILLKQFEKTNLFFSCSFSLCRSEERTKIYCHSDHLQQRSMEKVQRSTEKVQKLRFEKWFRIKSIKYNHQMTSILVLNVWLSLSEVSSVVAKFRRNTAVLKGSVSILLNLMLFSLAHVIENHIWELPY